MQFTLPPGGSHIFFEPFVKNEYSKSPLYGKEISMDYQERAKEHLELALAEKEYPPAGEGLRALAAADFPARLKPEHGDTWGNWTFNQRNLTLQFARVERRWTYEIDLERIPSMTELWLWVNQFVEKSDRLREPDDVGNLIQALHDLLFPTWFRPDTNPTEALQKMYRKIKVS